MPCLISLLWATLRRSQEETSLRLRFAGHAKTRSAEHGSDTIKSVKSGSYGLLAGMRSREGWEHVQRICPFLAHGSESTLSNLAPILLYRSVQSQISNVKKNSIP